MSRIAAAPTRDERRRKQRRRAARRWTFRILVAAALLAIGVALGQALHDNPKPGRAQTRIRTLRPLPLAPKTVTITVRR